MRRLVPSARRSRPSAEQVDAARARRRAQLAQAVASLRSSEGFRAWLSAAKRFHHYSPHNVLLIAAQRPDASYVAGLRTWRELGYRVRRGERGILILCPRPYRVRDEQTGEEERRISFHNGYVFDRAQVDPIAGEAKPLSPPEPAPVEGDSHGRLVPASRPSPARSSGSRWSGAICPAGPWASAGPSVG